MDRNSNRQILRNDHKLYKKKAKDRGIRDFRQYATAEMNAPSAQDVLGLKTIPHIWRMGDRYFKLATQYYGDATYWWVIAWFNQKPTEMHLSAGDPVYIPLPLEEAVALYRR